MTSNCADDAMPDYWFPELPKGNVGPARHRALALTIAYAIDKCNSCQMKQGCYEMGMQPNNIEHGIWGGVLAGERLRSVGAVLTDLNRYATPAGRAMNLEKVIKPYLEELYEETANNSGGVDTAVAV